MERTIAKDGYKWTNLLELNDRAGIWRKYGMGNGGGGIFMVDKDGTVLAASPTIEEIKKILEEKLGK